MTSEEFGQAATEVLHATLKIYLEVNHLLRDLRVQLQESMPVLPLASISDGDQALKLLRGWRGFLGGSGLYEAGPKHGAKRAEIEEDEGESEQSLERLLKVDAGGGLLFGKFTLHDFPRKIEPCFIGGVLSNAGIGDRQEDPPTTFRFTSKQGRRILEDLNENCWVDGGVTVQTHARIEMPRGHQRRKGQSGGQKLHFQLERQPVRRSLLELDSSDAARSLAVVLLDQWTAAKAVESARV